jgi:transcriptional regulator with XRE-family HTH domain
MRVLAENAGVSVGQVQKAEMRTGYVSDDYLEKIAKVLGVSLAFLQAEAPYKKVFTCKACEQTRTETVSPPLRPKEA